MASALALQLSRTATALRPSTLRTAIRCFSTTKVKHADEQSGKHVPFGALGSGYYSDNTKGCYDVIANAKPMMLEACSAVLEARKKRNASSTGEPFVIADFGCADAGTSLPLMHELVELVRKSEPSTPVVLSYEDQPGNDWTSVFRRLQGEISSDPGFDHSGTASLPCILDRFENVTVNATGVSFYNNCYVPASVDLMFSATAMHWFRRTPIAMKEVLHSAMLSESHSEFKAYWDMADADWRLILTERAKELKKGGRFGCVSFAKTAQGYFLGHSSHVSGNMHKNFRDIWADFASSGVISKDEFQQTNFPNQYRCMEEYLAPFGGEGGSAEGTSAGVLQGGVKGKEAFHGMKIVAANYGEVRCPYHVRWLNEKAARAANNVDPLQAAKEHAKRFVPTTRTWSNSTFESALQPKHGAEKAAEITEAMYAEYERRVAAEPEQHAMDYQHVYFVAEKH